MFLAENQRFEGQYLTVNRGTLEQTTFPKVANYAPQCAGFIDPHNGSVLGFTKMSYPLHTIACTMSCRHSELITAHHNVVCVQAA